MYCTTDMIRSLGFGLDRNAEPQPVDSEAVKLIKRGPEYDRLKRKCSDVTDAIDEALIALEINGYIALPADYPRPNVEWGTLDEIENRGVPEHMALLLAQCGPKPTRKKGKKKKQVSEVKRVGKNRDRELRKPRILVACLVSVAFLHQNQIARVDFLTSKMRLRP